MEGTLSLFDWSPSQPATPAAPAHPAGVTPVTPVEAPGAPEPASRSAPEAPVGPAPAPALADGSGPNSRSVETSAARIVIFDCETTGTDRLIDQVIELCVQHGLGDDAPSQTWRIKPTAPIHPGAQAVHGITLADLADCPPFAEVADAVAHVFAGADVIVGYNIAFDIDMLQAEYTRAGKVMLDLGGKKVVDAFRLWQQCEPRSLQHAHQRFVGQGFAAAHSASADVAATGRVLSGMLHHFNLDSHDWGQIASICDPGRASWVGPSRHLRWENEVIV
ncbi:MAG TPA: 3'-5' exonuclease, partial [Kofleriaceae bacterium]|nr:3'-5' exonuclease [Kofleriaceae bacterium]